MKNLNAFTKIFLLENPNFKKKIQMLSNVSQTNIAILTEEQSQTCEGPITESKLLNSLKSMPNNKSSGNKDLTKGFYKIFWEEIKIPLSPGITKSYQKLIEKKGYGQELIKNWRPISLLNVDAKIISEVSAERH